MGLFDEKYAKALLTVESKKNVSMRDILTFRYCLQVIKGDELPRFIIVLLLDLLLLVQLVVLFVQVALVEQVHQLLCTTLS